MYLYSTKTQKYYFRSYSVEENNEQPYVITEKEIINNKIENSDFILAPTQALLQKWLREEKGLVIIIGFTDNSKTFGYDYTIYDSKDRTYLDTELWDETSTYSDYELYRTYEEALEKSLLYALKILKEEK